MVTKLDRIARTAEEGIRLVRNLVDKKIHVHILNMGIANNTAMGKLMITIMSGFAEFERDMIIERTQAGKEIARKNSNFREGRPKKFTKSQLDWAMELLKRNSYKNVVKMTGISKSTLIREKRTTQ
jgi:DNA invertase Pin-like site-specific DNA recombinase